jgi:DnaJ family protein A protein 2
MLQPDTITGDIVFVLQVKGHPKFKREHDDLHIEHTLSLTEALCGFQFNVTHLDGRQLLVKSNPGEVVKPGTIFFFWSTYISIEFNSIIHYFIF